MTQVTKVSKNGSAYILISKGIEKISTEARNLSYIWKFKLFQQNRYAKYVNNVDWYTYCHGAK